MSKAHKYWRNMVNTYGSIVSNLENNRNKAYLEYTHLKLSTATTDLDRVEAAKTLHDIECELAHVSKRFNVIGSLVFDTLHCVEGLFKRLKYDVEFDSIDYDVSTVIIRSCIRTTKIEFKEYSRLNDVLTVAISTSKDGGLSYTIPSSVCVSIGPDSREARYDTKTFIVEVLKRASTGSTMVLRSNNININEKLVEELLNS